MKDDKEKGGKKRVKDGSSSSEDEKLTKKQKTSDFFVNPINVIKKEFADKYHTKSNEIHELISETFLIFQKKEAALIKNDAELLKLLTINDVFNELENEQAEIFSSDFKDDVSTLAIKQIQIMREYCDFFLNTLKPLFEQVKEIQDAIADCIAKIKITAGGFAESDTKSFSTFAGTLSCDLDELEKKHYQFLEVFKAMVENFEKYDFDEHVLTSLQTEKKSLYNWTSHWLDNIQDKDNILQIFNSALSAASHFSQENQHQESTPSMNG